MNEANKKGPNNGLEDLMHMLVHDLRTPLSAIYTGVVALLSDEQMDRETVCRVLGLAESNARRMLHMIETLVDIGLSWPNNTSVLF